MEYQAILLFYVNKLWGHCYGSNMQFLCKKGKKGHWSSHTCPTATCWSDWIRELLCLLWSWSESCGIPASFPTRHKEPLHRCSPKFNEAPWFGGSSTFLKWSSLLACLEYFKVFISSVFCWITSAFFELGNDRSTILTQKKSDYKNRRRKNYSITRLHFNHSSFHFIQ